MNCKKILYRFIFLCAATLALGACNRGGSSMDDAPPPTPGPTPAPTPTPVAQTWFFSDGAALTASQVSSFNAQGLYYNVHSAANPGGEIRSQIIPSSTTFSSDAGNPATSNTFSTLLSGTQEVPVSPSTATGYGTIVLDPVAKTIGGVLVTSGIVGTAAHIHDGLPGVSGPVIIPLTGGPTVWTVPAGTVVTDAQIAKLTAGAYYLNVHSTGLPGGEIRGQLTQQVRFAALSGANEVPAVTTTASATGVLALNPITNQISGFVKTTGIAGTVAHIHEAAAGVAGPVIIPLTQSPAGSGIWVVPAGQILTAGQAVSFNTNNLYFNVHSAANPGGEIRGQIVPATVKIGNAALDGSKEVPPVTTTATGTGIMVLNSVTRLVYGNIVTTGITGTAAHVHEAAAGVAGPVIVPMTQTPPPSTLVPLISTNSLANGVVGSAYSQTLTATGGAIPYTWAVATGTLPAGLNLSAAGVISGTPTVAGASSFTVRVTDSATTAATATQALSLTVTAAIVPLAVSTTSAANGTVGSAYSQTLTATGGTTPYTWAVATGALPAGLNLSAAGVISGTPTVSGASSFTVRVTDSATPAATATQALSLTIAAAPVTTISFSTQIQPIFTANCTAGCHSPGGISAFMNLTDGNAYASLVLSSPPRVIAGSSATSLLYMKITGAALPQMPLGRAPLSASDQTLIKNWIDQGAANN